jgi:Restriction endonuclease
MPRIPRARFKAALAEADIRRPGQSAARHRQQKGRALEDVVCDLLGRVPGVEVAKRNVLNVAGTEEVDILFWNRRLAEGFYHLETPFLVECKNWDTPVPAREIVNFSHLMEMRACRDGILVAATGIAGTPGTLTEAYFEISAALAKGRRILVINRADILSFRHTDEIVELLKLKILELTTLGTSR